jgi:DNA-binding XRE family transcriptional regulator
LARLAGLTYKGVLFIETGKTTPKTATIRAIATALQIEDWNLVTACRPCHVAYDVPRLTAARAEAPLRMREAAGQLELFPELA